MTIKCTRSNATWITKILPPLFSLFPSPCCCFRFFFFSHTFINHLRLKRNKETLWTPIPPPLPSPPLLFPLFFHISINPLRLKSDKKIMLNPQVLGRKETSTFKFHDFLEIFHLVSPFLQRNVETNAPLIRSRWRGGRGGGDSRWPLRALLTRKEDSRAT